ncbi:MAG: type IV secretion system protein [Caulobacterales bacterium]
MEPGTVNSFLDQFLGLADAGFGLIQGDVAFVLNALIVISITLAGAQWALGAEAPMAPFFRKVLFVGFFAFLVNNWDAVATAINESGAMLGLRAGGSGLTLQDLHNPARMAGLGKDLFGRTIELGEGLNIITDFPTLATIWLAALLVMIAFFVLALQVFVGLIAFKLGSLAAFVALPWGVFSGTAWVAERPLGWVATSAVRLFLLAFVASVAVTFVEAMPTALSLENGGALDVLLFGCTILALSWLATTLASEVMQGSPSLSAVQPAQAAAGIVATGAGAAVSARVMFAGRGKSGSKGAGASGPTTPPPSAPRGGGGSGPPRATPPPYAAMIPRPRRSAP